MLLPSHPHRAPQDDVFIRLTICRRHLNKNQSDFATGLYLRKMYFQIYVCIQALFRKSKYTNEDSFFE